nr:MAG TPA: hypothetical protein [Caudoviricetes sp.]
MLTVIRLQFLMTPKRSTKSAFGELMLLNRNKISDDVLSKPCPI